MGWGINDANYQVFASGVKCKFYTKWYSMLNRCFSMKYQTDKPTYKDKIVCEDWRYFMSFRKWMEEEQYTDENGYIMHLDKDLLLKDNFIYSPITCVFVPPDVNGFMTQRQNDRGIFPIGVSKYNNSGKFKATISNITCARGLECLGVFETEKLAHLAWQKAKIAKAEDLKHKYKHLIKVCSGLDRVILQIEHDIDTGNITGSF